MSYFTQPKKFKYGLSVKLHLLKANTAVNSVFPRVEDFVLSSKQFDDLETAIQSVNILTTELTYTLNKAIDQEKFGIISESREDETPLTHEWDETAVAKIWIVDKEAQAANKTGGVRAIGMAQIVHVLEDPIYLN
jgi:hypothetical protein